MPCDTRLMRRREGRDWGCGWFQSPRTAVAGQVEVTGQVEGGRKRTAWSRRAVGSSPHLCPAQVRGSSQEQGTTRSMTPNGWGPAMGW